MNISKSMQTLLVVQVSLLCFLFGSVPAVQGADHLLLETREIRITDTDFEASLVRIPQENRAEVLANRGRIKTLLDNLTITKTFAARARALGLDRDPAILKQLELAQENILSQAYTRHQALASSLPDFSSRAMELYKVDLEKYTVPERVHASHLLVTTANRKPEEALQRAKELRDRALGGESFEALVEKDSDDPTAKDNRGNLGHFAKNQMVKPFSDAAFAMTTSGQISEPVRTSFGYHLIQYHGREPKVVRSFEAVKEEIVQGLREQYLEQQRKDMIAETLQDPTLKLYEDAVDRFHTDLKLESASPEPAPKK